MYNISAKNLKQLKKYPDNDHIKSIIYEVYKQAIALAKDILGMIISNDLTAFQPEAFISRNDDDYIEEEIKNSLKNLLIDNLKEFKNINNHYISFAAKEIKKWEKLNFSNNSIDDFIEAYNSLSMILNSNYTFNYNFKFMIRVVNNQLNLTVLIKQR